MIKVHDVERKNEWTNVYSREDIISYYDWCRGRRTSWKQYCIHYLYVQYCTWIRGRWRYSWHKIV